MNILNVHRSAAIQDRVAFKNYALAIGELKNRNTMLHPSIKVLVGLCLFYTLSYNGMIIYT